jgi:hypothetical protein
LAELRGYDERITAYRADAEKHNDADSAKASAALGILPAAQKCGKEASQRALYGTALDLGAGVLWKGKPGKLEEFEPGGTVAWVGYRQPLSVVFAGSGIMKNLMIGGSGRFSWDEFVTTGDKATPEIQARVVNAWVGLEYLYLPDPNRPKQSGSDWPGMRAAMQYGYQDVEAESASQDKFSRSGTRWLASGSLRLSEDDGIWLGVSYGNAAGTTSTLDDQTFLVTLDFAPPSFSGLFGETPSKK